MPAFTTPASGGASETGDMAAALSPGNPNAKAPVQLGGEIMLSKAETAALTAIHFGASDPRKAEERARRESGLSHQQIQRLKARSDHARSKGMTLKGDRLVLKPTAAPEADEPGLLRDDVTGKDAADEQSAKAEAKEGSKIKVKPKPEAYNTMRRGYAGRKVADATPAPAKKKAAA